MKSMKKNLVFWAMTYEKMAMAMLMGMVVYVFMLGMMNGFSNETVRNIMGFMSFFLCLMILSNGYSGVLSYFPQSVSMGTTRKDSFIAMQIMQHVIAIQFLVMGGIAYYMVDRAEFAKLMEMGISIVGGVFILIALSNLVCSTFGKFSRNVGTALYVLAVVAGVAVTIVLMLSDRTAEGNVGEFFTKPYLFFGGILADIIAIGIYYRVIKKQDLQF